MANAKDYRVYPLPKNAVFDGTGKMTSIGATYRCAGNVQQPALPDNGNSVLGYVYLSPASDRLPVYALGDPSPSSDDACGAFRFRGGRLRTYTQSITNRDALIKKGYRNDGVVFYVPSNPTAPNHAIKLSGRTFSATGSGVASDFTVFDTQQTGTEPLIRYRATHQCAADLDNLAAGTTNYLAEARLGDQPMNSVTWTEINSDTTLVVEALDQLCPNQGFLTPVAAPSAPGWVTLDQQRAASPTQEVYVNGQGAAGNKPKAIARSFVTLGPKAWGTWDWTLDPGANTSVISLSDNTKTVCTFLSGLFGNKFPHLGDCFQQFFSKASPFSLEFNTMETDMHAAAVVLGELRTAFVDWAADTNGKFRVTPNQKATMSDSSFLHVTMESDVLTTNRRYPQIFISDQDYPTTLLMGAGSTILVQLRGDWPYSLEVQVCSHWRWDVNAQCPGFTTEKYLDGNGALKSWAPVHQVGEKSGMDRRTQFDVYASSKKVYVFADSEPYACVLLPAQGDMIDGREDSDYQGPGASLNSNGLPAPVPMPYKTVTGPVSVTFGETLYHSGAPDSQPEGTYSHSELSDKTKRHFGNMAFVSGVAPPVWDESILPCIPSDQIHGN